MITLQHQLANIKGIDRRFLNRLHRLKIKTIKDLLWHFPVRYEDYSQLTKICRLEPGQTATIRAQVKTINLRRTWRKKMTVVEAVVEDDTGQIKVIWFNQPYIAKVLRPGKVVNFSGKVSLTLDDFYLSNPVYGHRAGLTAIYPETKGLTSKGLRFLIKTVLKNITKIDDFIPPEVLTSKNLPEINTALLHIHFPKNLEEAQKAKDRFAFEDLFLLQLHNQQVRLQLARKAAYPINFSRQHLEAISKTIPFKLTSSQKQCLTEILNDIRKPTPMNRLLQGDVGSGKTIVAAIAAILTIKQGLQAAFMAPTEVLARQHYQTITKTFGEAVGLLTGSEARYFGGEGLEGKIKKSELINQIKTGKINFIIGTHAIIQEDVKFKNLALAIIDEQHRFGVRQRARFKIEPPPHFLSMSATPIPRTLAMTLFGDLDLSIITELPAGRQPVITKIVAPANRQKVYRFIKEQIKQGRQAFVICPRIEARDGEPDASSDPWGQVKAAEEEYAKLSQEIFPDLKVAMLHGRLKSAEKQAIMNEFASNKIHILVSTSVVEIGVDVPNATIMMIEGADRFGLAQLYQFRGRVGRGQHQSYCLLFTDSSSSSTHRRLKSLLEAKNGFELAEKDLALRGPGQFLGEHQTGLPDLAMSSLTNAKLVKLSKEAAQLISERDPTLNAYPQLKEKLEEFKKRLHLE